MKLDELKETLSEKHSGDFITQMSFNQFKQLPSDIKKQLKVMDCNNFLMVWKK